MNVEHLHSRNLEFLICSICLDVFSDPYMLSCLHSFCKACLDKIRPQWGDIKCPYCRTSTKRCDVQRDYRCIEFIQFIETHGSQDIAYLKMCTICTREIDSHDAHLCKECSQIFCTLCKTQHLLHLDTAMHTTYSFPCGDAPSCSKHKRKMEFYFNGTKKKLQLICVKCTLANQDFITREEQESVFKNEIYNYLDVADKRLDELNNSIKEINKAKEEFQDDVCRIRKMFRERRDKLINLLNSVYNGQDSSLSDMNETTNDKFNSDLEKLEARKKQLLEFKHLTPERMKKMHFLAIKEQCDQAKHLVDNDSKFCLESFEYRQAAVLSKRLADDIEGAISSHFSGSQIHRRLSIVGQELSFDGQPRLIGEIYETVFKLNNLVFYFEEKYILTIKSGNFNSVSLLEISQSGHKQNLALDKNVDISDGCSLAILSGGHVLICYRGVSSNCGLIVVFRSKRVQRLHSPVQYLKLVCCSISKNLTYLYSTKNYLACVDSNYLLEEELSQCTTSVINLPYVADFMASNDSDLLAFSKAAISTVFLYSTQAGNITFNIGQDDVVCTGLTFFQSKILLVSSCNCIHIFHVETNHILKTMTHFATEDCEEIALENVDYLTKCSQTSFLVHYCTTKHKIAKIGFS